LLLIISSSKLVCKRSGQRRNTQGSVDNPIADRNNQLSLLIEHLKNSAKDENEVKYFFHNVTCLSYFGFNFV